MDLTQLEQIISNKLIENNYKLISMQLVNSKDGKKLNIVIDRIEPINMEDIVSVSDILNRLLDETNPIECAYTLDISSLGAEKPLEISELNHYINRFVNVHTINPIDGMNIIEGDLSSVANDSISITYRIKTRSKTVDIQKSNISKIRLAIKF